MRISHHNSLIGLGANLGDPQKTFSAVCRDLEKISISPISCSRLYLTAPHDNPDQEDYINAVVLLQTRLDAESLLRYLLELENKYGRVRDENMPKAARTIDLDLLLFDDLVSHSNTLILPHPRMHLRNFTLTPACDIAPGWIHPVLKISLEQLSEHCDDPLSIKCLGSGLY